MNEMDIVMLARVNTAVAEMYALNATLEGMKAENAMRESRGEALAYGEQSFKEIGDAFIAIRITLERLGDLA